MGIPRKPRVSTYSPFLTLLTAVVDHDYGAAIHQGSLDIISASLHPQPRPKQIMLATNFEEYEKGIIQRVVGESLFGTGILMSDGMSPRSH